MARIGHSGGCGSYTASFTTTDLAQANDAEPNGNSDVISSLPLAIPSLNSTVNEGHLGYLDADSGFDTDDWYQITVSQVPFAFEAKLEKSSPFGGFLYLYNSTGGQLLFVSHSGLTNQTLAFTITTAGTYYVRASSNSGCGSYTLGNFCANAPDVAITFAGEPNICPGESILLTATAGLSAYSWLRNGMEVGTNQTYLATMPGTYQAVGFDGNGCDGLSEEVVIGVFDVSAVSVSANGATTFCEGESITLTATALFDSYAWSNGASTQFIEVNESGTYSVTATTTDGCDAVSSNSIEVTVLPDADGDGTCDFEDGCPNDPNKIAPGECGCGVADTDSDLDGVADCNDPCPNDPNDLCTDPCFGVNCEDDGDPCTTIACVDGACVTTALPDSDNDGVCDNEDPCPNDPNDLCTDPCFGVTCEDDGDPCTTIACVDGACVTTALPDSDNDGVCDNEDPCPNDPNDLCTDPCFGVTCEDDGEPCTTIACVDGNCVTTALPDSDNDGVCDNEDPCPNDPNDLCTDPCFDVTCEDDGDPCTTIACVDGNCVTTALPDSDNDGVCDNEDPCPNDPNNNCTDPCFGITCEDDGDPCTTIACVDGTCVTTQLPDGDNDGVCDNEDGCPNDGNKTEAGLCGCGEVDVDIDNDQICDTDDDCVGSLDAIGVCNGDCEADLNNNGICDTEEGNCLADAGAIFTNSNTTVCENSLDQVEVRFSELPNEDYKSIGLITDNSADPLVYAYFFSQPAGGFSFNAYPGSNFQIWVLNVEFPDQVLTMAANSINNGIYPPVSTIMDLCYDLSNPIDVTRINCDNTLYYPTTVEGYVQGSTLNGNDLPGERTNEMNALGDPEGVDELVFVSLGYGGSITLSFDCFVVNGPGADLRFVETSYGTPGCEAYPEYADVYLSANGDEYVFAKTVCKSDNLVDLDDAGLSLVSHVRVVNNDALCTTADAYDLDGVEALNGCVSGSGLAEQNGDPTSESFMEKAHAQLTSSPNPTNGPSQVTFETVMTGRTLLEVYDLSGRNVATLFNQIAQEGQSYRLYFDGSGLPNGVYVYRMTTESETIIEKFMIAR